MESPHPGFFTTTVTNHSCKLPNRASNRYRGDLPRPCCFHRRLQLGGGRRNLGGLKKLSRGQQCHNFSQDIPKPVNAALYSSFICSERLAAFTCGERKHGGKVAAKRISARWRGGIGSRDVSSLLCFAIAFELCVSFPETTCVCRGLSLTHAQNTCFLPLTPLAKRII